MWKVSCFVLFVSGLTLSHCVNPGMKLMISQKGLDFAHEVAKNFLESQVQALSIPNISGKEDIQGELKYEITNIKVEDYKIIDSSLTFVPDVGIQMAIKNSKATILSNWNVEHWTIKAKEKTTLELSEASFIMAFKISKNDTGSPLLSLNSCQSDIKKVEIKLNGPLKLIQKKYGDEKIKDVILKLLNSQICTALAEESKKWAVYVNALPVQHKIDDHVQIDYRLVNSPVFTNKYADVDVKGTFYAINNRTEPALAPAPFTLPDSSDSMLYVGISEYTLNSLAQAYFDDQALHLAFTHKQLDHIVKELDGVTVNLPEARGRLRATKAPVFTLKPKNMTVELAGQIELVTKENKKPAHSEITVNITSSISADVSISESNSRLNVTGSLTLNSITLHVVSEDKTKASKFAELEKSVKNFIEKHLVPTLDGKLKRGVTIPSVPFIKLVNPISHTNEKFFQLNTDIAYNFPRM
ncbi:BPI fold-containing family C protein-like [Microcaecilia unicolor]|uniref:Bactericidal permeability-increasing protein n=1 Tax=Microcaecilia unicolor TaxID=1415580 RepID=A0A6P7Z0P7_9AMPH|nr:BPI fold-containing family C protein-like [Microcaecilia unicolor]